MRFGSPFERKALADLDPDLAAGHDLEQLSGGGFEFVAGRDIIEQRRASQEQRTLLRQDAGWEWINRTGGIAEAHHHAAPPEAIERLHEGVSADGIVDHGK